ncbi:hypothetical protein ACFO0N_05160 [Halobium salinum]|uniref:Uncharacterized protein n=1 Tax=Halobium salinum TaxID=1364940 RepID=A0ABD5P8X2_9EURY|nr:hypothetical protein [Halobium salinum]
MIVVATEDFALYHALVSLLRDRGAVFTTVEPDAPLPERTSVVITGVDDGVEERLAAETASDVAVVVAGTAPEDDAETAARRAVEAAMTALRGEEGRTVVGVDPGTRPGIAVLVGDTVVSVFQVPLADAVALVRREVEDAADPLVRVGDGARLQSARIVNDLDDVPVELVDETGTTPYLGEGARGMGDVLAAVNIARRAGERVEGRAVDPTAGEIQRIKSRSRELSAGEVTIDEALARRVAAGELTVDEALAEHRRRREASDEAAESEENNPDDRD